MEDGYLYTELSHYGQRIMVDVRIMRDRLEKLPIKICKIIIIWLIIRIRWIKIGILTKLYRLIDVYIYYLCIPSLYIYVICLIITNIHN
jgi:hypothetical protein